MELTFECPACESPGYVPNLETTPEEATCPGCGHSRPLHPEALEGTDLRACAWCATEDLYIQKDFPQRLGLTILLLGIAGSTIFVCFRMPIGAMAVLLATAAVDAVLYHLVPDVTICYRCLSQFRGPGSNAGGGRWKPFDLAIGERYRQERLRIEELRQRRSAEPK